MQKNRLGKGLYQALLQHKIITVCVLFTFFTMSDTITILAGWVPPKTGLNPYIHLLGRFVLHSLLIFGLFFYDFLCKKIKSKVLVYGIVYLITWSTLLGYLRINSLFVELHPDAYIYATTSYTFMYLMLGLILLVANWILKIRAARQEA